jgi:4-hydroxybenzoate polyprenyltransferase
MTPSVSGLLQRLDRYEKLLRLDKPIGILLLLWPTLWALWLSANGHPNWKIVWIFVLGTVLMRSAGVAVNDVADRRFDPYVERTKDRPVASGAVKPVEAMLIAAVLALIAFVLIIPLGSKVIALSFCALFLAVSYPLTKRFFFLPQAYLGVAFGFGIPMAYAAQMGQVPLIGWTLLLANIAWTIAYDTEYAMVDRADDAKLGIKTSALLFGRFDVAAVMACHAVFLGLMCWIGWRLRLAWPYYIGLAGAMVFMVQQYFLIRARDPQRCFTAFLNNNWLGCAVFAAILLAGLLQQQ